MGRDDRIDEPVPNFQCPSCGKMSVVKGYFQVGKVKYTYQCLACGHMFG